MCSYNDNQITLIYFTKPAIKYNMPEKLSRLEPKLQVLELAGPSGRRLERKLSCNVTGDMVSLTLIVNYDINQCILYIFELCIVIYLCSKNQQNVHFLHYYFNLIIVSSTCFEHPSVHPLEDLYMQFYGISFMYPHKHSG